MPWEDQPDCAICIPDPTELATCMCSENKCQKILKEECNIENPDPDGYLLKICEYLKEHKDTIFIEPADPTKYNIESIEEGEYEGRDVYVIRLDCCHMGDIAWIDKETKEVISFSPGDI
jgi:hypothetical protein